MAVPAPTPCDVVRQRREQFRSTEARTLARGEQDAGQAHGSARSLVTERQIEANGIAGYAPVIPRAAGTCRP